MSPFRVNGADQGRRQTLSMWLHWLVELNHTLTTWFNSTSNDTRPTEPTLRWSITLVSSRQFRDDGRCQPLSHPRRYRDACRWSFPVAPVGSVLVLPGPI